MAFNLTPEALALMMGGLNMMAASRGGNPDLSKGGFGYAALQGLQGGLQGLQLGKQMQDADVERAQRDQKQKAIDDMLMKLNLSPSAMQSTGVLAPGVQQSPLAQMSPEQKELAKMAILSGDWQSVAKMISPQDAMTPYQRESLDLQRQRLSMQNQGMTDYQRRMLDLRELTLKNQASQMQQQGSARQTAADIQKQKQQMSLNEELNNLQGVLADINRAEELLTSSGNIAGPIIGRTPNISEQAQELESLTQALGIGRLQQFKGATSEKELAAALRAGLSMTSDKQPNLNRLAAQRKIVEKSIERITGMMPKQSIPEGVTQDLWDVMTDEERAAWQ